MLFSQYEHAHAYILIRIDYYIIILCYNTNFKIKKERNGIRKLNEYGLTPQQEIFCQEYIKEPIMYRAFIKAYPKAKNWKRNSVDSEASKLLNNTKIDQRIKTLNQKIESTLANSTTLSKRKILEEIIELQQKCKQTGNSQNTTNIQALKLLSQIAGMLQENKTEININNNIGVAEVSQFLDL